MKTSLASALLLAFFPLSWASFAGAEQAAPSVTVQHTTEEGRDVILVKVLRDGKPVEGAKVEVGVERLFGVLSLGRDETLDDGTASVAFPKGLPGSATGELKLAIDVEEPGGGARSRVLASVGGARPSKSDADPFPEALWAPKAPRALVATICIVLGGVWLTYVFVFLQLFGIRKGE